jgi:hypothetical protein
VRRIGDPNGTLLENKSMPGLKGPELPLAGGCPCEGLRYEVRTMPLLVYACHCRECQRRSGGSFSLSMPIMEESLIVTRGWPKFWRHSGASGGLNTYWFCGECGGSVYEQRHTRPHVIALCAGTLDDTSWLRPIAHIHLGSAQAWERIPNSAECFEVMPGDFWSLADKWKQLWRDA